uniref:Uncharacterized protein n=1 Tax=Arundo donax TaxID=35708 RepID=A0A0A8Z6N9_ARUDO
MFMLSKHKSCLLSSCR